MNETPAVRSLIRRIEANPLDVPLYHQLAELYAACGHFRKSELVLRRAIEIAPLSRDTWVRLGRLLSALGNGRARLMRSIRHPSLDRQRSTTRFASPSHCCRTRIY